MASFAERARWIKSCAVTGCRSGQDKAIVPARNYLSCPARKIHLKPYDKSFTNRGFSVHKQAKKKELGQYQANLTSHVGNNPYIYCILTVPIFGRPDCGKCGKLRSSGNVCYPAYLSHEQKQKMTSRSLESEIRKVFNRRLKEVVHIRSS